MQAIPDVYLVNGYAYGRHQNGHLIGADDALVMIDSGDMEEESFATVREACARWGYAVEQVSHLLITHAHFDHASHAAAFRRLGAKIVASRDTAEAMTTGDDRCIGYAMGRTFEPCETDVMLGDGESIEIGGLTFTGLAAPGHTDGLMVFEVTLRGERLWFCGDLLKVGKECEAVELGWPGSPDFDRVAYLETLRRLIHLPPCHTLFPGHGPAGIGLGRKLVNMAYTKAMVEWR